MKKLRQIDYECYLNERVFWLNIQGERFEGKIKSWNKDKDVAVVIMDDGTEKHIEC